MKPKHVYALKKTGRRDVEILKDSEVVGYALKSKVTGHWWVLNGADQYVGKATTKENIIPHYKRKKGLGKPPKE